MLGLIGKMKKIQLAVMVIVSLRTLYLVSNPHSCDCPKFPGHYITLLQIVGGGAVRGWGGSSTAVRQSIEEVRHKCAFAELASLKFCAM